MDPGTSRAPTLGDVARRAGVSTATVSFVLNGRAEGRVSAATQVRVQEAVDALGYVTHAHARALRNGRGDLVILALGESALTRSITRGFTAFVRRLAAAGFTVAMGGQAPDKAKKWAELRPAAVVVPVSTLTEKIVETVRRGGGTVIGVGRVASELAPTVVLDDGPIGRAAAAELVARGRGNLVALVPSGIAEDDLAANRLTGIREAAAGVRPVPMDPTPADAARVVDQLLRSDPPDGVVGTSDVLAGLVLGALLDRGVAVPGEVAVVGIDDEPLCEMVRPRLTSVGYDAADAGAALAAPVLAAIADEWDPALATLSRRPLLRRRET
ncbi:LacI family DNA-binding transcriptional regulator [Actinokineospora iranica]|nr:LacI family DNA-binding transcriptional regulator [Actinokineospora iranica]